MGNDLGFRLAQHQLRGFDDVVQNGHVLEQVEALKHNADLGSLLADLLVLEFVHPPLVLPVASAAHQLGVHPNTLRYRLRQVDELFDITLDHPDDRLSVWLQLRAATG